MTENYIKTPYQSCIYLWRQFSAVSPCNQIPEYANVGLNGISLPIKKARRESIREEWPLALEPASISGMCYFSLYLK